GVTNKRHNIIYAEEEVSNQDCNRNDSTNSEAEVESKVTSKFSKERLVACIDINFVSDQDDAGLFDSFASNIAESTYDGMNVDNVIKENCSHLTKEQQKDLRELLLQHEKLFDGTLRTYTDKKMDIELLPEASAVWRCLSTAVLLCRKELQRLCDIGVLKRCGPSEWGLPSFIIPKKDGKVRWVSDLRELNKAIKPVNYTLPIISDIVRKRQGYKYMTKLDLSMMFYAIELTDRAKELCVISTHFGNFQYERAPMGLRNSPAFAQSIIEDTLRDIDECEVYIDDVGKQPIEWTDELEQCFKEVKAVIARDTLLQFPNHNLPFDIYTEASDFQMGACIMQAGKPVAYFSRKLSGPQTRYTTTEKELLAIVCTLNEYRSMLFGATLNVYTDHLNLTYSNFNTQRVLRWRVMLEEFQCNWFYLAGKLNVLADAFSRLPRFDFAGAEERKDDLSMQNVVLIQMPRYS
ncbi:hypothetical protein ACHAXM_008271, partial [Skeletonema potamos]